MTSSQPEEDVSRLVAHDELSNEIQPHIRSTLGDTSASGTTSLEYINPAVEDREDADSTHGTAVVTSQTQSDHKSDDQSSPNGVSVNGSSNHTGSSHCVASPPVYYSSRHGESVVVAEPVVIRYPNGVHMIQTQQCCEMAPHRHRQERPLRKKHIRLIQAFSIVAIVIFFPLGIPACYFAFKCEREFEAGILRGDIDLARKLAKRAERLIIFSVLAALLVAVAVFAFVERAVMEDDEDYWKNRANGAIMPTGL